MKYKLKDVCATEVEFDVVDGRLKNVSFSNGCSGNLKALSVLLEGRLWKKLFQNLKALPAEKILLPAQTSWQKFLKR